MPEAFVYVRVSTDEQTLSPDWQRQVCLNYYETSLRNRGFTLGGVFEDIGQSAYKIPWAEREAGRELFKAVKPGSVVIVSKQDRAWRSVRDRENSMFFCQQMNIHLAILDAQIDTTTAAGKFAAGVIALQSAWESDVRSERIKAAYAIRRTRKTPSRRNPPPGWKYDKIREQLLPDLRERRLLELIYRWRASRIQSIEKTCLWLTEIGIRRDSGAKYNVQWVQRAWMSLKRDWPAEGYVQTFWKDPTVSPAEKARYRLPKVAGKHHVNFHPLRTRQASEADLRWISHEYGQELIAPATQSAT